MLRLLLLVRLLIEINVKIETLLTYHVIKELLYNNN